jgi:hypothetical protein
MDYHLSEAELVDGLDPIRQSPKDAGSLDLIVTRPLEDQRVVLTECELSGRLGLRGDRWAEKCWKRLPDGSSDPDVQITLMNSRCVALLAQDRSRWPLAGDQLYVDLDIGIDNLQVGQQLAIGSAILQITDQAHTGCEKFAERYGTAALNLVNSPLGKQLRLRGVYARVIQDGRIEVGDSVAKRQNAVH